MEVAGADHGTGDKVGGDSVWIDTHCHFDAREFDHDRDAVFDAAIDADVNTLVVPAVERANFGAVAAVCRDYAGCYPAYGIHPMYVTRAQDSDIEAVAAMLADKATVAVGEIGLDGFVEPRDDARQAWFFAAQLQLARERGLPVLLHVRRAIDLVLKALRRHRVPGGIAHAFNGSRQQADEFIKLGFKLGFGGSMSFTGSRRIRELAATVPLESIVLETDAPDIPPEWQRHERNSPAQLPRIAAVLAELRGISLQEVARATAANARSALPGLQRLH